MTETRRDHPNMVVNAQGYHVRRSKAPLGSCPECGAMMAYQEWTRPFAATVGRDTCGNCGYTSQRFAVA